MTKTPSLTRAEVALTATMEEPLLAEVDPETPLRLLVAGDLSAAGTAGGRLGFDRLPVRVDRDSLDDALSEMDVSLTIPLGGASGPATTFRFRCLEDFHPDRIIERTPAFGALRRSRAELRDPATFEDAAARVRAWAGPAAPSARPRPAQAAPRSESEDVVAELLASAREKGSGLPPDVARLVQDIAARHAVPADHPDAPLLIAAVDAMIGSWLNAALHDPAFQALEAAWRGAAWLADRLETDSSLQLWLLDVSQEELSADLRSPESLEKSGWHRILVEQPGLSPEPAPWAAVAGLYTFGRKVEDVALLARLGRVAELARAPFLAAASPDVVGSPGFGRAPDPDDWDDGGPEGPASQIWTTLRELSSARSLGLAAPRFLLRLPYGKDTEPAETVAFEEMPEGSDHEGYLWGNPALACLALLGQAFSRDAWDFRPGSIQDVPGLPIHVYEDGESRIKPCAEAILSPRAAERLLDAGVMPLLSIPGRDAVRLARFQSLAIPPASLAGRWSR
jgi:type VI secretion system protein ImpC